ncbi:MAG TPA: type II toxin-antitoxin system HicB family antitoxin [Aggregatilinea sp.]|uniref:type II toxin-antitoxin system HicB family antitoxin n=1 Tax=Aggregatilinea sp. TaxID=2806333 RepID=UPI002BD469EF|nr:type II toxin-antitoxin system HicB family antitoxin [Aggregatilinea sp.]HML24280.1 type II toxin-antitoxin system HicB family antitoxin [Aggregatilinea sp.]
MRQVVITPAEEGGFWASVPSLPGCFSQGETLEETIENIKEAIQLCIDVLVEDGQPVPDDNLDRVLVVVEAA